jgi:histidyl-tRNA synthetase
MSPTLSPQSSLTRSRMASALFSPNERRRTLKQAREVADFYGFSVPTITPLPRAGTEATHTQSAQRATRLQKVTLPASTHAPLPGSVIAHYLEQVPRADKPALFYHNEYTPWHQGKPTDRYLNLEIFGVRSTRAEAMLIQTARSILEELGLHKNILIEVNSLGDKESLGSFTRECVSFYRTHESELNTCCQGSARKDIFSVLYCPDAQCSVLRRRAPKPITFLSEASRTHFRHLLEYLEAMDVPYAINEELLGVGNYYSETLFEIRTNTLPTMRGAEGKSRVPRTRTTKSARTTPDDREESSSNSHILVQGGRYDELARRLGSRRTVPAVGASLLILPTRETLAPLRRVPHPLIYFIRLGDEAHRQSFRVYDILRTSGVPFTQALDSPQLGNQLGSALARSIPYTLIMGQKEAMERSVIFRHTESRAQETIPLPLLGRHLKSLTR